MARYELVQNRTDGSNNNVPFTIPDKRGTYKLTAKLSNGTEIDMGNVVVDGEQHEYKITITFDDNREPLTANFTVDRSIDPEEELNNISLTLVGDDLNKNVFVQNISPALQEWCNNNDYYIILVLVKYIPHCRSHDVSKPYWRRGLTIRFSERTNSRNGWTCVGTGDDYGATIFNGNEYYKFPHAYYLATDSRPNSPFANVHMDDHFIKINRGNAQYNIKYMTNLALTLAGTGIRNIITKQMLNSEDYRPYVRFGLMPVLTKDCFRSPLNGGEIRGKNICWFKCNYGDDRIDVDSDFISKSER